MKKLIILPVLFASLISCTKTNDLVSIKHRIQYWKDHVANANSAWECPGDSTWYSDTTLYYNHGLPQGTDANLVTHRPNVLTDVFNVDGFDRLYFEYLN